MRKAKSSRATTNAKTNVPALRFPAIMRRFHVRPMEMAASGESSFGKKEPDAAWPTFGKNSSPAFYSYPSSEDCMETW